MKETPRICRNCIYCDKNALKMWCSYWNARIGPIRATAACSKFISFEEANKKALE